jgi:hypothetical protein
MWTSRRPRHIALIFVPRYLSYAAPASYSRDYGFEYQPEARNVDMFLAVFFNSQGSAGIVDLL